MPCYYKSCISFLILLFILNGFSEDMVLTCPEEFADGEESNMICTVNFKTLEASPCLLIFNKVQFIVYWSSFFEILCSTDFPPACSRTLSPGSVLGSCGCIKQTGDEYTYQFSFPANKSWHLNAEIRCVPCTPFINVTIKINGSCKSMKFKNPAYDVEADLTDYDRQLEEECDEIYRAAKTTKSSGLRKEYALWKTVLVVWIQKVIVSF